MGSYEWCVDCLKPLKGRLSWFYGLCPRCRKDRKKDGCGKNYEFEETQKG